jgi:hypothetical protein
VRGRCGSEAVQSGKDARFWQVGEVSMLECHSLLPALPRALLRQASSWLAQQLGGGG